MIEFAVPHQLAFTFFPHWVMDVRKRFAGFKSRLVALNVHDAVMHFTEGSCDLLMAYHHPSQPLQLNPDRYEMLSLGQETLAAYAKADGDGQPLFRLQNASAASVPFLSYAAGAYLGRLVELITKLAPEGLNLEPIYETDMAEGLKVMALEGHGIAFLPQSAVRKEVKARRLVSALPPEIDSLEATMEIRAYRERPTAPAATAAKGTGRAGKASGDALQSKRSVDALWAYLVETQPVA
jgi:DNA-binding transcriptional LysR family regulator